MTDQDQNAQPATADEPAAAQEPVQNPDAVATAESEPTDNRALADDAGQDQTANG